MPDTGPLLDPSTARRYFFDAGLRFACTGCGGCCTGSPGQVLVSETEIARLAAALGLTPESFRRTHTRTVPDGVSLRERENGDCVLLEGTRCSVHAVKPAQCGTFPFWAANLRNEQAWEATRRRCEGIGQGRLYSREEILDLVNQTCVRTEEIPLPPPPGAG
jgi:Fe-S-cluster containining protein